MILVLSKDIIKPNDPTFKDIPDQIIKDDRYHPFKNCTNAIDGTHVQIIVPIEHQIPYTCRKGYTSTNVMVVCDFNMCFTFLFVGWEVLHTILQVSNLNLFSIITNMTICVYE